MLLRRNLDDFDEQLLLELVSSGATESQTLEFKQTVYGNGDEQKKEFLKDVSSLANAEGGYLLIGIDESDGAASAICPIQSTDQDSEILRLQNMLLSNIEPRILGLKIRAINVSGGYILAIFAPKSYNPPHRVIFKGSNRFFSRHTRGTYEPSVEELRVLFGQQISLEDRARKFVADRVSKIQFGDGAVPLASGKAIFKMHIVPLPNFGSGRRIELQSLKSAEASFRPIDNSLGYTPRYNLDGFLVFRAGPVCHGYTQVFRDGAVEAVSLGLLRREQFGIKECDFFDSRALPSRLNESFKLITSGMKLLEIAPPFLIQISLSNLKGLQMKFPQGTYYFDPPEAYIKETLSLPASVMLEYEEEKMFSKVIAEQMDFLWNVFNFERCWATGE